MSEIKKSIKISAPITPYDTNDTYPTHDNKYGKGGYKSVSTIEERDNIPLERREEGMLVWVQEANVVYLLENGIANTNWTEFLTRKSEIEGTILISSSEPSNPEATTIWLNREDGLMRYRNRENTEWIYVSDEDPEDDYGSF